MEPRPESVRAWALLKTALALGLLADLLLRELPWGLNFSLWAGVLAAAVFLFRRWSASHPGRRVWPLVLAAAGGAGFAWRDSPTLGLLFVSTMVALSATALLERPLRAGVGACASAVVATLVSIPILMFPVLAQGGWRERFATTRRRQALVVLRGTLLAMPLLLLFGALFASADPLFERTVTNILDLGFEDIASHTAFALLFAVLAGGLLEGLDRFVVRDMAPPREKPRGSAEVVVVLLLVDLLFLAFLAVQAGFLFGGREIVETTLGLSYAEYARQGFFQLVTVATIVLPLLLAADWAAPPGSKDRRKLVPIGAALVLMTAAVLASAAYRMRLYQEVYGLTELRLYTSAFILWLGIVFAWLLATVFPGRRERFAAPALAAACASVLALAALNPDALIVRVNASRAHWSTVGSAPAERPAGGVGFDAGYAASLSADAVPALVSVLPRLAPLERCAVAEHLLARWLGAESDWRTWNWSRWRAIRLVQDREPALRRAADACRSGTARVGRKQESSGNLQTFPIQSGLEWNGVGSTVSYRGLVDLFPRGRGVLLRADPSFQRNDGKEN